MSPETVPGPLLGGGPDPWDPNLVRKADCRCCGRPVWAARMCSCGHARTNHDINKSGERTQCFHMDSRGPCDCKRFNEVMT